MSFNASPSRGYEQIGPEAPLLSSNPPSPGTKHSRVVHYIIGGVTAILVVITFISSFIFHKNSSVGLNVFFSSCILLACISNISMIIWYRYQLVASPVRFVIYFNSIIIILLCICANLYHHGY